MLANKRRKARKEGGERERRTGLDSRLPNWTVPITETRIIGSAGSAPGIAARNSQKTVSEGIGIIEGHES